MPQDQFPPHSFITHSQFDSHIRRTKRNTNELVPFVPVKQWKVQPVITKVATIWWFDSICGTTHYSATR